MQINKLFEKVLVEPALDQGADSLCLISGYATATMAHEHICSLAEKSIQASINVIVGMVKKDGIEKAQHLEMVKLARNKQSKCQFSCRYILQNEPVHAKVYVWLKESKPLVAFSGSANYTLTGFKSSQIEVLNETDPKKSYSFYQKFYEISEDCNDPSINSMNIFKEPTRLNQPDKIYKAVTLSLLTKSGEIHKGGGLNWGQRKGREPNQAYIPIHSPVNKTRFFPLKTRFAVLTDDGESFIFIRAQDDGKALHSPDDNSIIGRYFRSRIGVEDGAFVHQTDLKNYGRTDVTFTKFNDETYYMDFSVPFRHLQSL